MAAWPCRAKFYVPFTEQQVQELLQARTELKDLHILCLGSDVRTLQHALAWII